MQTEFIIRDYREGDKAVLMEISLPWLEENHILEPADIDQLTHPERVLGAGGRILLAEADGRPVGMMMLEPFGNGVAEPFKFGVLEAYRNHGIGKALMEATIDAARAMGVHTLVLTSHHSLKAALHIYESYGFRYEDHDHVTFELSDIAMKKEL